MSKSKSKSKSGFTIHRVPRVIKINSPFTTIKSLEVVATSKEPYKVKIGTKNYNTRLLVVNVNGTPTYYTLLKDKYSLTGTPIRLKDERGGLTLVITLGNKDLFLKMVKE